MFVTLDQRTPNLGLKYEADATRNYNWAKLDDLFGKLVLEEGAMADQAYAKAKLTVDQTIPPNTATVLNFQEGLVNVGGMYTPTQPDRFTIQVSGFYLVGATVAWMTSGPSPGQARELGLSVNDPAAYNFAAVYQSPPATAVGAWSQIVVSAGVLSAGDRLYLVVQHDAGAAVGVGQSFFWVARIGTLQ